MLVVVTHAGMGNQMFQYALALCLRLRNRRVLLDISQYQPPFEKIHNGYDLYRAFGITDATLDAAALRSILQGRHVRTIQQKAYENYDDILPMITYEYERAFPGDNWLVSFYGFWQYRQLVAMVEEPLRAAFTFREDRANPRTLDIIRQVSQCQSVAMHIRRGDYVAAGLDKIATNSYYDRAINIIESKVHQPRWFILSDEPDWVRRSMILPANSTIIAWNAGDESWQDMLIMSRCKHHIIPNSTFSWWGAWLAKHEGQVVVMPTRFIPTINNIDNYQCDNWITA